MPGRDSEFRRRLLATFKGEAEEHLEALASGLAELSRAGAAEARAKILEGVFREAHSLKGAARAVGLSGVEQVCHAAENLLSALQRGRLELSPALVAALQETVDGLARLLPAVEAGSAEPAGAVSRLLAGLAAAQEPSGAAPALAEPPPAAPGAERAAAPGTVRVAASRLEALLFQAEELLSAKLAGVQHAAELRAAAAGFAAWKKSRASLRPLERQMARRGFAADARLRRLPELIERDEEQFRALEAALGALARNAAQAQRALAGMVDGLLDDVKKALMLPAASALAPFAAMVRELCREQGKEAELLLDGGEIEIDRRILQELRAPLTHLVRNGVDHGIEAPAERARQGKPARGTIRIALVRQSESTIEIAVSDDGAGIDAAALAEAAVKLGQASREALQGRSEAELLPLAFASGVSTSRTVTDLSGRGLGLAIVREKVEALGGRVAVEARRGAGTTFRLAVPLTLATFRGVHLGVAGRRFVVPTTYVQRVLRVERAAIRTVENRETIEWNGRAVALVRLAQVLELDAARPAEEPAKVHVAVLGTSATGIAFAVDEVLEEREVLAQPLGPQLERVRNVAGAALLGSGELAPILDVPDLLRAAARAAAPPARPEAAPRKRKAVLVAEDSITSRTLLKAILEAAGYDVATAVDGAEAYALLKARRFDALVSDVDMPRMNGFDLTTKVRGDSVLAALPVVLVTSLESREHRERGVEAGASAYIVKRSFDQSDLLGTLGRLL